MNADQIPVGKFVWHDLMTTDVDRAVSAAGMLAKPAESPGPSLWMPYIEVDDIDATAARVPELGGQVFVKPMDIPGVGRFAVLGDPTGATFGLLRSEG